MSLQISEVGLIIKEKVLQPFWNRACQEQSEQLWLPTKIDCAGLDSKWSNSLSSHLVEKSWFSTTLQVPHKKKWYKTSQASYMSLVPDSTDLENIKNKLKTISTKQKTCQHSNCQNIVNDKFCKEHSNKKECKKDNCNILIEISTNKFFCKEHYQLIKNTNICNAVNTNKQICKYKATSNGFCGHHSLREINNEKHEYNHSRLIRIDITKEQLKVYREIFGIARKAYNDGNAALRKKETTLSNVRNYITNKLDTIDYCKKVPLKIKQGALEDLIKAKNNAIAKWKKTNKFQKLKYRKKNASSQSIYMNKDAIKKTNDNSFYFYINAICEYFSKKEDGLLKVSETLPEISTHCRLILKHYKYLYISIPLVRPDIIKEPTIPYMVTIDPGERNFVTLYSNNIVGNIGNNTRDRFKKLFNESDLLKSKITKLKNNVRKYTGKRKKLIKNLIKKLQKKYLTLITKPSRLVKELHNKTALFLCKNFKIIGIPEFSSKKVSNNLPEIINRCNNTLSHYRFRERLIHKAKQWNRTVHLIPESYTSCTCTRCGTDKQSKDEILQCDKCNLVINRDYAGSRNILLKTIDYFRRTNIK